MMRGDSKPASLLGLFEQDMWWRQRDGSWIKVADMAPGHRYNAAAIMLRGAHVYALQVVSRLAADVALHDGGEMAHDSLEKALDNLSRETTNPAEWMRGTPLYRALTQGLAISGDGKQPWQATGRDPETGASAEVPPQRSEICSVPACGCSGKAHG